MVLQRKGQLESGWDECAKRSKQEDGDAMGVHHLIFRRPEKDREFAILRCDHADRLGLVVHELRGRKMARAAQLSRRNDAAFTACDRFEQDDAVDRSRAVTALDLRSEAHQFIAVGNDGGAVHRHTRDQCTDGNLIP